ncbi:MAG: phosphocholine-specific phospholipase C [Sphingobacteriaceae bacterium]
MDSRRAFLKKSLLFSGALGISNTLPAAIQKAMAINPAPGSTYLDAEHIVLLMQENRSFDHCFGTLRGVRGFNDPRATTLPDKNPVWLQSNAVGQIYAPFRLDMKDSKVTWMGDLPHSRSSQVDALNNGKYDRWLDSKRSHNAKYAEMPLTLGHYNREDLPFHYAMADAFTICDQHFCSCITSTTPNRSYFWSGNILSEENGLAKANIRNNDFAPGKQKWETFPELLDKNHISWKAYQNDLSTGGGFTGVERSWLANFGCNVLEFFEKYNVKFSARYVKGLQNQVEQLPKQINGIQEKLDTIDSTDKSIGKLKKDLAAKQTVLLNVEEELVKWSKDSFNQLSKEQQNLFQKAFTINDKDPDYHTLTSFTYDDDGTKREITVPKGDLFHQFREDVESGQLPTVSWLTGPQNFSDHPSAPWYGAWYVSEILDILTKKPEVWKKTIFILTYDENDGYFDHIPPFLAPDARRPETGKCSPGIDTEVEWIRRENELKQGISAREAREAPIGLGFRVPMVIASPWSRGGNVCSQVFDHTSTLQFLETFVNNKWKKDLHLENISAWRRTVCGNLTAAFKPFEARQDNLPFLVRDQFVKTIFDAQFKKDPTGFKVLTTADVAAIKKSPFTAPHISHQEAGNRPSNALPYELHADGNLSADGKSFQIKLNAGNRVFGISAVGSPFTIYAGDPYLSEEDAKTFEAGRIWSYAVKAGDTLADQWPVAGFEKNRYDLRVCGPNGFLRAFAGSAQDPKMEIYCEYEPGKINAKSLTGNIRLRFLNLDQPQAIEVIDNSYNSKTIRKMITNDQDGERIVLNLQKSFGWYDFTIRIKGNKDFERHFAGRVETGKSGFSDPVIGRKV